MKKTFTEAERIALNEQAKEYLLKPENRDRLSIALAHYIFRDGPIEDMHANGQLSQEDMMTLNKFVVNQIATLRHLLDRGRWDCLYPLMYFLMGNGEKWDAPEVDFEGLVSLFGENVM